MLLHVSILRSSSGSTFCSLLKLYVKTISTLLYVSVVWQHIVCMCICCICCREVDWSNLNFLYRFLSNPQISAFMKIHLVGADLFYVNRCTDGQSDMM